MQDLRARIREHPRLGDEALAPALLTVVFSPTGTTTAGFPFLGQKAYETFRDRVPHILGMGQRTVNALAHLGSLVEALNPGEISDEQRGHFQRAAKVVRTVVNTASVTAPPDLWLLRHVLGVFKEMGFLDRMLAGGYLDLASTAKLETRQGKKLKTEELVIDLNFLLARGYLEQVEFRVLRMADSPETRRIFQEIQPCAREHPANLAALWGEFFGGETLASASRDALASAAEHPVARKRIEQSTWFATLEEIQLGFQMLPIVLGMRVTGHTAAFARGDTLHAEDLSAADPDLASLALEVLELSGALERQPEGGYRATAVGTRVFTRGPGPFGIIEAYHGYMHQLPQILVEGRGKAWVQRGANIAASQDANRKTFETANDALDRFCEDRGFKLGVFIEHAVGRGEATRQRWARSGDAGIHYFGADLEDAAIEGAREEQAQGRLPSAMKFIRDADIANPPAVVDRLRSEGLDPHGAVMFVGNGFHEARNQQDEAMVEVFRGYHDAGIILLFTEESALSVDDLLSTAWNTYHAGFKYVHQRSGQGLRPAGKVPSPSLGRPLPASWNECATLAGYVRARKFCSRTRTIFPYQPRNDHNPAISVNHFFVPKTIAEELGLEREE